MNVQARYTLAVCLLEEKDARSAIEELSRALERQQNFVAAHNLLGVAYAQTGNTQAAVEHFGQIPT